MDALLSLSSNPILIWAAGILVVVLVIGFIVYARFTGTNDVSKAAKQSLRMPAYGVELHILLPGHEYEEQPAIITDIQITAANGAARLLVTDAIRRINTKIPLFATIGDYLERRKLNDGYGIPPTSKTKKIAIYRKHEFWPVMKGSQQQPVDLIHSLIVRWVIMSYKWARQRAEEANRTGTAFARPNTLLINVNTVMGYIFVTAVLMSMAMGWPFGVQLL